MEQLGQEDPQSFKRLIWAMILMAVVFGGSTYFMRSKAPPAAPVQGGQATKGVSAQGAAGPQASAQTPQAALAAPEANPVPVQGEKEETFTLENDDLRLVFGNKGGILRSAVLKKYRAKGGPNDDLVSPLSAVTGAYPLAVRTGDGVFDKAVSEALFHVEHIPGLQGADGLRMSWADGKGNAVTKTVTLPASGYELGLQVSALKGGRALESVPLTWGAGLGTLTEAEAKNKYFQQEFLAVVTPEGYKKVDRDRKVGSAKPESATTFPGGDAWAGLSTGYFAAIFIPDRPLTGVTLETFALTPEERKIHPSDSSVSLIVGFPGEGKVFIGPKEYGRLRDMGDSFYRILDWGSYGFSNAILNPICAALLWGLKGLHGLVGNYGVAILLLTLIIKLAFYPLTQRSMVKMKEMGEGMKKLKPQLDRIKAKYKKLPKDMANRAKLNEEMMGLYQREGINPLGGMSGCLPLLLQMPIFFALFTLLPKTLELRGAPFFGWIHDLSMQDPYYVTPILMGLSMFASTKMTSSTGMEGSQKMLLYFMPVMFTWICLWAPAGLTLYWLANNLLTMGQQAIINRQVQARQEAAAKGRKSTPKGPSRPS